jgi:sulfur-oxidizing protein SoxY
MGSRREFLSAAASVLAAGWLSRPARAAGKAAAGGGAADGEAAVLAGRTPIEGGIDLQAPAVAENGAAVPVTVSVPSPMTGAEHVRAIHLIATRNPTPGIATFRFTARSPVARVTTRIRLAEAQTVIALAELSDGRVLRASADISVSIGGCVT